MRYKLIVLLLVTFWAQLGAQDCSITLSGTVKDQNTKQFIEFASIYLIETKQGVLSDEQGSFNLENLCPGEYHIAISHIGCSTQHRFIKIEKDTAIFVLLDHNSHLLNEISLSADIGNNTSKGRRTINSESIDRSSNKNLADILSRIEGVRSIKSGANISKPIIQGLYGNRLSILNNGVQQAGQQWGSDHSPEIDPLQADNISVIKGASSLQYPASQFGAIVLVSSSPIKQEPHLHGKLNYYFESNGRGNGISAQVQKHNRILPWRIGITGKKSGDKSTSDYYLSNTGSEEYNFFGQFEKDWTSRFTSKLYLSSFNTKIGILRGSHISNLSDLEMAISRDVPFFTEDRFSYDIKAPRQEVQHNMLKLSNNFSIVDGLDLVVINAFQFNDRQEYDVRRSSLNQRPSLSLEQFTAYSDFGIEYSFSKSAIKLHYQFNYTDNTNVPETGILPLIPDYLSASNSVFALFESRNDYLVLTTAVRYDGLSQNVAQISNGSPRVVTNHIDNFDNFSASASLYLFSEQSDKIGFDIGLASRSPGINELYSAGLHQGVGGIEEGNPNLKKEFSQKISFVAEKKLGDKLFLEGQIYANRFQNYIYLQAKDSLRLTIRGAFPVFEYKQNNALIYGLDIGGKLAVSSNLNLVARYSFIKGLDLDSKLSIVNLPSNDLNLSIDYQLGDFFGFKSSELMLGAQHVFKQTNIEISQDYMKAPDAYTLLNASIKTERIIFSKEFYFYLEIENITNAKYREYLNRMRYFADDLGRNIKFGIKFNI